MSKVGFSVDDSPDMLAKLLPLTKGSFDMGGAGKKMFLNPIQQTIYNFGANETFCRMGRGTGKTSILAMRIVNIIQTIPRGSSIFLCNSIKQGFVKTFPNVVHMIEELTGLEEGKHFFRGRPPKSLHWPTPLVIPRSYESVIYFYTGHVFYICSLAVRASTNGLNACSIIGDETRYLNWMKVKEEVLPTLRGHLYDDPGYNKSTNPYYLSQFFVSDAALTIQQAQWEKEINLQTTAINKKIAEMLAEANYAAKHGIDLGRSQKYVKQLRKLQCQSRVFFNASSIENISILGEDYIKKMQRQLPEMIWRIQVLSNLELQSASTGYYPSFDETIHGYIADEESTLDTIQDKFSSNYIKKVEYSGYSQKVEYNAPNLDKLAKIEDCTLDTDVKDGIPLRISMDIGMESNFFITAQVYNFQGVDSIVVLSDMYVTGDERLRTLCRNWHTYYKPHQKTCKKVILYTNSTFRATAYGLEEAEQSKYENVVKAELENRGWQVHKIDLGKPMDHWVKYQFMDDVFKGLKKLFVRINTIRAEELVVALNQAQSKLHRDRSGHVLGVKKDKGKEKLKSEEGEGGALATRTDITDGFDEMVIGCIGFGEEDNTGRKSSRFTFFMPD